jgi:quercetin dioxygenase-like cupin family protein
MSDRFEDHRGVIQDVLGKIDAVTRITTVAGAVRGNHVHRETTQWTLVLSGRLLMASGDTVTEMGPGEVIKHPPGMPHAWKAVEDTDCLVFTRGPRSGADYETDTYRLQEPLL